ncbi:M81 family metallopeptidase [Microbacterium sp. ET2]|uniref:M81 family metallopeptidase n=1 Tax=Microbacterium albipurpureum TaxID=3050384 RepID=UPI00259D0694|nr:M81 family metallopeptidase [Microbacterium sp. ET2 (Ac-2212)]WJL96749.1 M81 family metallopeptidase [Microbacterium sp. ET2 (Ac-2212)]
MKLAIAGIYIEASTFSRHVTRAEDFIARRGADLVAAHPLAAWLGQASDGVEWVGALHAMSGASGPIDADVYDAFESELLERLRAALPLDGVWLPLHGALSVVGRERVEERLVGRIREVVGVDAVLSASMDPHGNMSAELASVLDLATCHRHAPHIDHEKTRRRAVRNLVDVVRRGVKPAKAWVRVPVLLPGERTSTVVDPGRMVFGRIDGAIAERGLRDGGIWIGFAWADEERNTASTLVTGDDEAAALACAEELARSYWEARESFEITAPHYGTLDEAFAFVEGGAATPVVISDAGDNVTAGASGDITYALHAVRARAGLADRRVLVAGLVDPAALTAAVGAGVGARLQLAVGAGLDDRFGGPVLTTWEVERLVPAPDGARINGALLRHGTVSVTVQWARDPFVAPDDPALPPGILTGVAHVPWDGYDIVLVKNGYQFPSQVAGAGSSFIAVTPGGTDLDMDRLAFTRVERPLYPFDREFEADLAARLL